MSVDFSSACNTDQRAQVRKGAIESKRGAAHMGFASEMHHQGRQGNAEPNRAEQLPRTRPSACLTGAIVYSLLGADEHRRVSAGNRRHAFHGCRAKLNCDLRIFTLLNGIRLRTTPL